MVLSAFGITEAEEKLRSLCVYKSTPTRKGVWPPDVIPAARQLGFTKSVYRTDTTLDNLKTYLSSGLFPIAGIWVDLQRSSPEHAVVVVEITDEEVVVLDPADIKHRYSIQEFLEVWHAQPGQGHVIIVE